MIWLIFFISKRQTSPPPGNTAVNLEWLCSGSKLQQSTLAFQSLQKVPRNVLKMVFLHNDKLFKDTLRFITMSIGPQEQTLEVTTIIFGVLEPNISKKTKLTGK